MANRKALHSNTVYYELMLLGSCNSRSEPDIGSGGKRQVPDYAISRAHHLPRTVTQLRGSVTGFSYGKKPQAESPREAREQTDSQSALQNGARENSM